MYFSFIDHTKNFPVNIYIQASYKLLVLTNDSYIVVYFFSNIYETGSQKQTHKSLITGPKTLHFEKFRETC